MKYELDSEGYILSWCLQEKGSDPTPITEMDKLGGHFDEFGQPKYQLQNGEIILKPKQPTAKQLSNKKEKETVLRIREQYPHAEYLLLAGSPEEKAEYQEFVDQVKIDIEKEVEVADGKANK